MKKIQNQILYIYLLCDAQCPKMTVHRHNIIFISDNANINAIQWSVCAVDWCEGSTPFKLTTQIRSLSQPRVHTYTVKRAYPCQIEQHTATDQSHHGPRHILYGQFDTVIYGEKQKPIPHFQLINDNLMSIRRMLFGHPQHGYVCVCLSIPECVCVHCTNCMLNFKRFIIHNNAPAEMHTVCVRYSSTRFEYLCVEWPSACKQRTTHMSFVYILSRVMVQQCTA